MAAYIGGTDSDDVEDVARFKCVHQDGLSNLLQANEGFSAMASGPRYCAIGTTLGNLHVVTLNGDFIASHASTNMIAVVTQVCIVGDLVVFGDSCGNVSVFDWRAQRVMHMTPAWPVRGGSAPNPDAGSGVDSTTGEATPPRKFAKPVRGLAVAPNFTWGSGSVFVGQEAGAVMKRTRSPVSGRVNESLVFDDDRSSDDFETLFYGLPKGSLGADAEDIGSLYGDMDARHTMHDAVDTILCDDEFVFFAWHDHVYAYGLGQDRIISRFGSFPKYGRDLDGGDDTTSLVSLAARPITLQINRTWIVVAWGSRLILCDRTHFAQHPFRVVHQFELSAMIRRVSFIAHYIVVCSSAGTVSVPHEASDDTTRAGAGGRGNTSWEEGNRISQSSHAPRAVVLTEAPEIHLLSPDGGERGERFVLPPSAGKIIAAPFSHAQLAGDESGGSGTRSDGAWGGATTGGFISGSFVLGGSNFPTEFASGTADIATHCYFLCPRHVYILRVLTSAELILELVKQQRFPLAMHLCQQKFRRPQVFMEVAGMHANALWKMGRCEEAVRVWGEVHLPSAPALYWSAFIDRLEAAGRIDLAVKWLPFNDRTKVGHDVYERILLSTVDAGDYLTVLARVSRWPVLYKFDPVVAKVTQLLEALIFAPVDTHRVPSRGTSEEDGTQDMSAPDAHQAEVDACSMSQPEASNARNETSRGSEQEVPVGAREAGESGTEHRTAAEEAHKIEIAFVLLVTLFKLYEFGSRFTEAAQILIRLDALRLHHAASGSMVPLVNLDAWEGDDESYTYALHATLKTIGTVSGGLRSSMYFDSKRLWGLLLPSRSTRHAHTLTATSSDSSVSTATSSDSLVSRPPLDAMRAITRSGAHDAVVLSRRELDLRHTTVAARGSDGGNSTGERGNVDASGSGGVYAELARVLIATAGVQHVVKMLTAVVLLRIGGEPGIDDDAARLLRECGAEEECIAIMRATAHGRGRAPALPHAMTSPPRER